MARTGLQGLAVLHHALDGVGRLGAGKLLLVGLAAADDGHGQLVAAEVGIDVEDHLRLGDGLLRRLVDGVPLLPPELARTQEGTGRLLPADDRAPLVIQHRQLTVAVQHVRPVVAEHRLGRRAQRHALLELLAAAHGDPRGLGRESLDQLALLLQEVLGDQDRHRDVDVVRALELSVHELLDVLPDGIAIGAQNREPLDGRVVHQLRLQADVGIPLGKILLHGSDRFYISLVFGHIFHQSFI